MPGRSPLQLFVPDTHCLISTLSLLLVPGGCWDGLRSGPSATWHLCCVMLTYRPVGLSLSSYSIVAVSTPWIERTGHLSLVYDFILVAIAAPNASLITIFLYFFLYFFCIQSWHPSACCTLDLIPKYLHAVACTSTLVPLKLSSVHDFSAVQIRN